MWTIKVLAATAPLLLLAMVWQHWLAEALFAVGTTTMAVTLMRLGAARRDRRGSTKQLDLVLGVLLAVLSLCLLGILYYGSRSWEIWGVPVGAWLLLGGVWLLPLLWVSLGYAWTFRRYGLSQGDLRRIRRAAGPSGSGSGEVFSDASDSGEPVSSPSRSDDRPPGEEAGSATSDSGRRTTTGGGES